MVSSRLVMAVIACHLAMPAWLPAQMLKPETMQQFECYAQSAEGRMAARPAFVMADADSPLAQALVSGKKIQTVLGNGPNPHKIAGAMIYDWIGAVFIPSATVERTVRMLQDYDHRASYFPEIISTSRLLCRTGEDRFGFSMRLKEPAVIDSDNDVVWERVDAKRWRCRSYSTQVREIGKDHNYLLRLNSYWRFAETDQGVLVEGQTITLSGEFGSFMRTLGSLAGINPEKSLKKTLESMRESLLKPGLEFHAVPSGRPACGEPIRLAGCPLTSRQ
jgi:hypothetical protein